MSLSSNLINFINNPEGYYLSCNSSTDKSLTVVKKSIFNKKPSFRKLVKYLQDGKGVQSLSKLQVQNFYKIINKRIEQYNATHEKYLIQVGIKELGLPSMDVLGKDVLTSIFEHILAEDANPQLRRVSKSFKIAFDNSSQVGLSKRFLTEVLNDQMSPLVPYVNKALMYLQESNLTDRESAKQLIKKIYIDLTTRINFIHKNYNTKDKDILKEMAKINLDQFRKLAAWLNTKEKQRIQSERITMSMIDGLYEDGFAARVDYDALIS